MVDLNVSNFTDFGNILTAPNVATNDFFWTGIVWMVFFVVLILTSKYGIESAILSSAFIGIIFGALLLALNLVSLSVVGIFVGIEVLSFLYLMWSSQQNV